MAKLIIESPGRCWEERLDHRHTLGTHPTCTIRVEDPLLPPNIRACDFRLANRRWEVYPQHATLVNGERITHLRVLRDGDEIAVGGTRIRFVDEPLPSGPAAVEDARRWFGASGLCLPPVPDDMVPAFMQLGSRFYGTWRDTAPPYHGLDHMLALTALGLVRPPWSPEERVWQYVKRWTREEYLLFAYNGDGINSYEIAYHLIRGPLALFVSIPWGGAYMDPEETTADVNETLPLVEELIRVADGPGLRAGRPGLDLRLILVSEPVGSRTWWMPINPGDVLPYSRVSETTEHVRPTALLREAIAWVEDAARR